MNNLYIFGDSFSTNFSTINEIKKEESWPVLLSNSFNLELKNYSSAGISNFGLLNIIYKNLEVNKIKESDIVIIGFTFYDRMYDFYKDTGIDLRNNNLQGYESYEIDYYQKKWINENSMAQYTQTALLQYKFILDCLDKQRVKFLFWNMDKCGLPIFEKLIEKYQKNYINPFGKKCWIDFCDTQPEWWQTNNDRHFGKLGHSKFFQYLYSYIIKII